MNAVYIGGWTKIFFLAGPVRGGGDWQRKAIEFFVECLDTPESDTYIVCPCRYPPGHPCLIRSVPGETEKKWRARGLVPFADQTLWERHYLALAGKQGAILFWLPAENQKNPRPMVEGPYAQDTYGELGEWRARTRYEDVRVVVGAEKDFPGLSTIEKNFRAVVGGISVFHETLKATVDAAIALANAPR